MTGASGGGGSPLPSQLAPLIVQFVGWAAALRVNLGLYGSVVPFARTVLM